MLFDEKDLRVFENTDSRTYFQEILQSYYSQNYRATIVMLYSFVIYDLFIKLQTMANEGDRKAISKLSDINNMIADDEKYSKVESDVVQFFKDNCPLYFDRFVEDIEYLKNCRNKCAHLKVNDNTLFVPSDYHARMLICSMFDNILSVKAPFIMDLFSIAKTDVENYSETISYIPSTGLDDSIKNTLKNKYFKRMTYDSIKKSYKTFIRLLFVSEDENCINNVYGLYTFTYAMTDYIVKNGYRQIFSEDTIIDIFSKIEASNLEANSIRRNAFISLITSYSIVMDIARSNERLFDYTANCVLLNPHGLCQYRIFYPREEKSIWDYFKIHSEVQQATHMRTLFDTLKECDDFNLYDFLIIMIKAIPTYNGYYDADCFMSFLKANLEDLTIEEINNIMCEYKNNNQCLNRAKHSSDIAVIKKYIDEQTTNAESVETEN